MNSQLGYLLKGLVLTFSLLFYFSPDASAAQVQLSWPSDSVQVAGYNVGYGTSAGDYTTTVNAGNTTTATLSNLSSSAYYIAVQSYDSNNDVSAYSPALVVEPLTASAGSGGSISPSGSFFQTQGASQTFTITPASGYQVSQVLVNGVSVGAVTSYTLSNIAAANNISATFAPISYTITASSGANGSISPSGAVSVNSGASQSFTITPAAGYTVSGVSVDGASVGAVTNYTFSNVTATHTIAASFSAQAPVTYTITASAGANGSISPSGAVSVNSGASQSFTITPATGYHVSGLTVDGASVAAAASYTFSNVTATHTIAATFAVTTYTITATAGANGSISPSSAVSVNSGASQSFTITPAAGYHVSGLTVDGASVAAATSYTFSNVTATHTIAAAFAATTYTITATAGANGSISPSATVSVSSGASQTFTITPAAGCHVSAVSVDGVSVGAVIGTSVGEVASYTFNTVSSNHTISATFASSSTAVADAGPAQTVAEGSAVTLNGLNSTDAGGPGIASYSWVQTGGTSVALSNPHAPNPVFWAPSSKEGALTFSLTVTDKNGLNSTSNCIVNVVSNTMPPVANAGPDQAVGEWTIVTLNGSQSSGDIYSYNWKQIDGPPVAISDPTLPQPTFVAPQTVGVPASMSFMLTVTDSSGLATTDICFVNVTWADLPPQAIAGFDLNANAGSIVTLDGSKSRASNGIAGYRWQQTEGTPVTLSSPVSATPQFTAQNGAKYGNTLTFRLILTDTAGMRSRANGTVNVKQLLMVF